MISVVIPTWNRSGVLTETLRRLFAQDYPSDQYEIVVVDNACEDGTGDVVRNLAVDARCEVRVCRLEPNNLSRARNLGIREARGDVVLIMGDDIWAEPYLLSEHARFHAEHPEPNVGVLSQVDQVHRPDDSPFERFFSPFPFYEIAGQLEVSYLYFWTNNLSLKRSFLLEQGLFDEEFNDAAHEDIELGYRLAKRGLRLLYNERLTAHHFHPMTFEGACRQQFHRGLTYPLLERKVPEQELRERLGIFDWSNRPRRLIRDVARELLFNRLTVPYWRRYLDHRQRSSRLADALYWKVLMYYTNAGHRAARHSLRQSASSTT
jgi:glycosyltransferase involved in cell wall biosynthesis